MKILINQSITSESDIFICDTSADIDIQVNADLISTTGKIYILGKNVIINGRLESTINDVTIVGLKETRRASSSRIVTKHLDFGTGTFPKEWLNGRHISVNLQKAITISE